MAAANMVAKNTERSISQLIVHLQRRGDYFDVIIVMDLITRSYSSLTKIQSKMAANMSAKKLKYIFIKYWFFVLYPGL